MAIQACALGLGSDFYDWRWGRLAVCLQPVSAGRMLRNGFGVFVPGLFILEGAYKVEDNCGEFGVAA
ncbi:hypothetical protein MA16_Dca014858 [Dendrobium catenatum]|uniref:Uncharacterized protein n=1 Tax=Dendrobium catenatum TaxID=906689 RepID=A0A2I0V6T8_9ASPA|nr:hypothetical protein MA16_Dca014858 [Dendrobium catenatum]